MVIIGARAEHPDKILVRIELEAPLGEWKALNTVITKLATELEEPVAEYSGTREPFWTLIHRLGEIIKKVEAQHRSYS